MCLPIYVLCAGITEKAAQILIPNFVVHPAVNWFFMFLSTLLLSIVGVFVTEKIVEPRLGEYKGGDNDLLTDEDVALMNVTDIERKGLINAGITTIVYFMIIASLVVPEGGILRDLKLGTIVPSPLLSSMKV